MVTLNQQIKLARKIQLVEDETQKLLDWARDVGTTPNNYFEAGKTLARRLGAYYRPDGLTEVGFWTPRLAGEEALTGKYIYLEVFTPLTPIDFRQPEQTISCHWERIELPQQGEFVWAVLSGMRPGTREQAGSFYWLRFYDSILDTNLVIRDVLAESLPYGVFAPAELYDLHSLQGDRPDMDYLQRMARVEVAAVEHPVYDAAQLAAQRETLTQQTTRPSQAETLNPEQQTDIPTAIARAPAPVNILQLHVNTASPEGTLEGLTKIYQRLSDKLANGEDLTPAEQNYVGYDAIQLLPIEPTIEYRLEDPDSNLGFFAIANEEEIEVFDLEGEEEPIHIEKLKVTLRKPNTQNWGYDVPIIGSGCTDPSVLGTLRPDEVIDFIATLHNFSTGPIQLIYDLVYGHADNQAIELISRQYLKGPNMYGQDLNHQLPMVRAILLEMQRRKLNTGADGIRVDGGQDFRFFNPLSGRVEQDDAYLLSMGDVVQEINGCQRLMFTIFEDGRPWPEEGWETKSTYRDLIALRPQSYQWGPLIFAHNTPTLKGFWDQKWGRVCEVMYKGDRWITGCANHDTVRRGNQIDHTQEAVNWNLGETLPEVLHNAYDNPATSLWVYCFSPGLPMDFINALAHAPWGFFRNTDERYGVKVASEEVGFLDWQITPELYGRPELFTQLKALGFTNLDVLRRFVKALAKAMIQADYVLDTVAKMCRRCLGDTEEESCDVQPLEDFHYEGQPTFLDELDVPKLKCFARAFLEDKHEACRVSHHEQAVAPERAAFNLLLRNYRRSHPWLGENLSGDDRFNRVQTEDFTLFYGLRTNPETLESDHPERIVMVTHMGGEPATVTIGDWLQLNLEDWEVAIATPGLELRDELEDLRAFTLRDSEGIILRNKPKAIVKPPEKPTQKRRQSLAKKIEKKVRKKICQTPNEKIKK